MRTRPLRHPSGATAVGIGRPLVVQVQTCIQQGMAPVAGIGGVDGHLAVGEFAEGAAILAGDADALGAALGKTTFIEDEDSVGVAQFRIDPLDQFPKQGRVFPGRLADEDLGRANLGGVAIDLEGNGLRRLVVRVVEKETAQVSLGAFGAGVVSQERGEAADKILKEGHAFADQRESWVRPGQASGGSWPSAAPG